MDDLDFIDVLKEKTAFEPKKAVTEAAKKVIDYIKAHPKELAGTAIGGSIAGLGAYLASKPSKKDGLSAEQKLSRLVPEKEEAKDESFVRGLSRVGSNTHKNVADLMSKHPVAAGVSAIPIGAGFGRYIAGKLKASSVNNNLFNIVDNWGRELARRIK